MAMRLYACTDADIAYCEWVNWGGRAISVGVAAGALRARIRRCLFRNTPAGYSANATEALQIGFGPGDAPLSSQTVVESCRFAGWNSDDEVISVKTSDCTLRQLTVEGCSGRARQLVEGPHSVTR